MGSWQQTTSDNRRAYMSVPESGGGPGVLVFHAWWGLTDDFTAVCDWLASEGFVALAPSLYPDNITAQTIPEAEALRDVHDEYAGEIESFVLATVDQFRAMPEVHHGPIGVIGFSLGSWWAVQASLARPDDVAAVVSVYGAAEGDFSNAKAAYLGHFAENDQYEPAEFVQGFEEQVKAAGRPVTFYHYPGVSHWFFEPSQTEAYDPEATALVKERTVAFFREHLGN